MEAVCGKTLSGTFEGDWKITIEPGRVVTVGDVLAAVHASMRTQMGQEEWPRVPEKSEQEYEISRAYTRRVRGDVAERNAGLRRVDVLRDHNLFAGLVQKKENDAVHFKLIIKAPPKK